MVGGGARTTVILNSCWAMSLRWARMKPMNFLFIRRIVSFSRKSSESSELPSSITPPAQLNMRSTKDSALRVPTMG